jgi:Carbon storage regulator (could also regulate swarming and quorum sensing)
MLTLTRKENERIVLVEAGVTLVVSSITKDRVKIGIEAPQELTILRAELIGDKPKLSRLAVARNRRGGAARA